MDNVTITKNSASGSGDGVYIISGAYLDLSMCTVIDNDTQDIGLQGNLYLSMTQSKIGTIYCSNINGSQVQGVGINVHSTFSQDSPDDKVEVTLQGYEDDLTLLTKTVISSSFIFSHNKSIFLIFDKSNEIGVNSVCNSFFNSNIFS